MKSILASGNWGHGFKRPVRSCYRKEPKDLTAILIYLFWVAFRVQSDATHWTRRRVHTEHLTRAHTHIYSRANPTAHHPHISSVGTPHWLKVKWVARHSQCFTSISFLCVVVKCSLSSVPTCFVFALCTVIKTLSVYHIHCKKSAQQPKRASSLEWVWPSGWLSSKHRLWAQARQLLQLHGSGAHADQCPRQPPQFPVPRRRHRDSHQSRRFSEFRSIQQQQANSSWQSSIIVRTIWSLETGCMSCVGSFWPKGNWRRVGQNLLRQRF